MCPVDDKPAVAKFRRESPARRHGDAIAGPVEVSLARRVAIARRDQPGGGERIGSSSSP